MRSQPLPSEASRRRAEEQFKTTKKVNSETKLRPTPHGKPRPRRRRIELRLGTHAVAIHANAREVELADGSRHHYGALLLATGAEPVRLTLPGSDLPQIHYLRTLADSRALIAKAAESPRAVVIGASFIGLEVAASLRARGLEVHVVAPEARPMEVVLGPEVGDLVRRVHEEHGVFFHLGTTPAAFDRNGVALQSGERLEADFVVVGIPGSPSRPG